MLELEVKVLNIDLEEMENRLKEIGAILIADEKQINTVIDTPDKKIQNSKEGYLRIRESKSLINGKEDMTLTYKKNLKGKYIKENLEINSEIKEKDNLLKIFEELGYLPIAIGYKDRKSYSLGSVRFDLDTWDKDTYPEPYMEIEVEKESDLDRVLDLLDIDRKNVSKKSITELQNDLKQ